MDSKNYTQVLIDGKIYTLGGSEDEGYLQRAASYVNEKNNTLRKIPGFSKQSVEYQTVMAELNMADDYFKALEHSQDLEHQRDELERETYSLKHELVSTQMKLEVVLRDLEDRQRELEELTREKHRLERKLREAARTRADHEAAAAVEAVPQIVGSRVETSRESGAQTPSAADKGSGDDEEAGGGDEGSEKLSEEILKGEDALEEGDAEGAPEGEAPEAEVPQGEVPDGDSLENAPDGGSLEEDAQQGDAPQESAPDGGRLEENAQQGDVPQESASDGGSLEEDTPDGDTPNEEPLQNNSPAANTSQQPPAQEKTPLPQGGTLRGENASRESQEELTRKALHAAMAARQRKKR